VVAVVFVEEGKKGGGGGEGTGGNWGRGIKGKGDLPDFHVAIVLEKKFQSFQTIPGVVM
jgi:hypothetical protein